MTFPTNPTRSRRATTYLPDTDSRDDVVDFAKFLRDIEQYVKGTQGEAALIAPDGTKRGIPVGIFQALEQVANALANGNGVTAWSAPSRDLARRCRLPNELEVGEASSLD